jgi:translation initiation factor IF-3
MSVNNHKINDGVLRAFKHVTLIDSEGHNHGVVDTRRALEIAESVQLDLVLVSSAGLPVCRIYDYQKSLYNLKKKKKSTKSPKTKCIKFGLNTDVHDYNFKLKKAEESLREGSKVQIALRCRGRREIAHVSTVGLETVTKVMQDLSEVGKSDQPPKVNGALVTVMLHPTRSGGPAEKTTD